MSTRRQARPSARTKQASIGSRSKRAHAQAKPDAKSGERSAGPRKVKPVPAPATRTVGKAVTRKVPPRADLGAPVDAFFARQPPHLRAIVDQLRALIGEAAPDASSSLKWGMPFYMVAGQTVCAVAAFKAHVNLILPGPPGTFPDPDGLLQGDGKTGRHLKLRQATELPRAAVRAWLHIAATRARAAKS